jgi:predicted ABC-type ATPase
MPNVVILAGPNGAGKTSAARVLLRDELRVAEFVNADVIARGLSGFSPDAMAVEAGRLMLRRLEELAHAQQDFAFETTLSGIAFLNALERWRSTGYIVRIVYLWLASADVAVKRVHARVQQGGHTVPDDVDDRRWSEFQRAVAAVSRIREVLMSERPPLPDDHLTRAFRDPAVIERAMRVTHARVIRRHRLLNQPLVVWRAGEVQYLDPHTVPMPEGVTEEEMGPVFDYL